MTFPCPGSWPSPSHLYSPSVACGASSSLPALHPSLYGCLLPGPQRQLWLSMCTGPSLHPRLSCGSPNLHLSGSSSAHPDAERINLTPSPLQPLPATAQACLSASHTSSAERSSSSSTQLTALVPGTRAALPIPWEPGADPWILRYLLEQHAAPPGMHVLSWLGKQTEDRNLVLLPSVPRHLQDAPHTDVQ